MLVRFQDENNQLIQEQELSIIPNINDTVAFSCHKKVEDKIQLTYTNYTVLTKTFVYDSFNADGVKVKSPSSIPFVLIKIREIPQETEDKQSNPESNDSTPNQ